MEILKKIPDEEIKINRNKNPIKMSLFLSFLIIPVTRTTGVGSSTGWTYLENKAAKLEIKGGIVGGTEYLDTIQYGKKLHNEYNNYVNPFYLFDILTKEGKLFFLDYFKEIIEKLAEDAAKEVRIAEDTLNSKKLKHKTILNDIKELRIVK